MVGNEVSVEAVSFAGETKIIGITQKSLMGDPYFVENGHMFQADLPEDLRKEICKYVESALQAVGYDHGVSHTEVKLTEAGPRIVEINPRTAGGYIAEIIEMVSVWERPSSAWMRTIRRRLGWPSLPLSRIRQPGL